MWLLFLTALDVPLMFDSKQDCLNTKNYLVNEQLEITSCIPVTYETAQLYIIMAGK